VAPAAVMPKNFRLLKPLCCSLLFAGAVFWLMFGMVKTSMDG
jgi:hypothetical protein